MDLEALFLASAAPGTAIIVSWLTAQYEGDLIEKQAARIARDKGLNDAARRVMARTVDAAVTVMSFFPSFVAFVVSLVVLLLKAPASPRVLPYALAFAAVAVVLFVARPFYMIWSRSLYELHDRAPRLLSGKNRRPGKWSYLGHVRMNIFCFNISLILISFFVFLYPTILRMADCIPSDEGT